ncbi:hypothetical protein GWK47_030073 [Chionoecetes opilio]|uniref:Chitin-binding type-4 domain-containing protein n=1 Tax=Chionoecetes opilio TaxID=41210 RepID=A0A8J4YL23_CHIOP|nr:hypothetical protein GWK47_030073 [Chionoecetes opilio]
MEGTVWLRVLLLAVAVSICHGHGRLIEPPSRASAWRMGWPTPIDYNDNEGSCGGFSHQHQVNGGKCGVCGDGWEENPRPHEAPGGLYATGTLTRQYNQGQVITLTADITSNHRGYFEVRLCPDPKVEATQDCLDKHPLMLADGSGFKYKISLYTGKHTIQLVLPPTVVCTHCVLQWRYVAGNNWGVCPDGHGELGCGLQEEFRACADVTILPAYLRNGLPMPITPLNGHQERSTESHPKSIHTNEEGQHLPACRAVGMWKQLPGADVWCFKNCVHTPGRCPATHCECEPSLLEGPSGANFEMDLKSK